MRLLSRVFVVWTALASLVLGVGARTSAGPVGSRLRSLASRAANQSAWPLLRQYASSQHDREERGLAYFVLGYREYEAGQYSDATRDLGQAVLTQFSLADFAEYFGAASAYKADDPDQAAALLKEFSSHHPKSPWSLEALALQARVFLETQEAEGAIRALAADPRAYRHADLTLLLAQAYWQAQRLGEAAEAFQKVYYTHPVAPEADRAAAALCQLQPLLGGSLPSVPERVQTARADALLGAGRFGEARKEYDTLLEAQPENPWVGRWKVGRARCLLRQREAASAIEGLQGITFTDPAVEAERLVTMVETYAQQRDQESLLRTLNQLAERFPRSTSYASALLVVGNYFSGEQDWEVAFRHYKTLVENFPDDERTPRAHWWVAWTYYLQGHQDEAREAFLEHLKRYPNSPRVPAVLYWVGRLDEQGRYLSEARALYELLNKRFAHTYYAVLARSRLRASAVRRAREEREESSDRELAALAKEVPPLAPVASSLCERPESDEASRAIRVLDAVNLTNLLESYIRAALTDRPFTPSLLLALSRVEAEQGNHAAALYDARRIIPDSSQYEFSELPKEAWDLLYPRPYWKLVEREARANRLDPYLVMGLIRQESAFDPQATSPRNARGLMQILPRTVSSAPAKRALAAQRLFDPAYNVSFGCRHLRRVLEMFGGDLEQTLAAYNAGDVHVKDWLRRRAFREPAEFMETIPIRSTRIYVEAVLRDAAIYRQLMTERPKFRKCS